VDLWDEISLVPLEQIPDCLAKVLYKEIDSELENIRMPSDIIRPKYVIPKAALVRKVNIKPKSYELLGNDPSEYVRIVTKSKERIKFRYGIEEMCQLCDCLTLVGTSAPIPLFFWTAVEEWVPGVSLLQGLFSGTFYDMTNISLYKLTQKDCEDASSFIRKYFELNKSIQELLRISIQRLNLSRRRSNLIDKAIDLGIALEALLLHDGKPDAQIAFPFRLRGAWLLGQDARSRRDYLKLFKEIYELRCKAVHSGRFGTKFSKKLSLPAGELLKKGDELCVGVIKRILEQKKLPDWEGLILGDANLRTE
jgi:hypothetical protein